MLCLQEAEKKGEGMKKKKIRYIVCDGKTGKPMGFHFEEQFCFAHQSVSINPKRKYKCRSTFPVQSFSSVNQAIRYIKKSMKWRKSQGYFDFEYTICAVEV